MSPTNLILLYCAVTVLASLAGGWLPSLIRLTHLRTQLMMSLVSGVMLGVALLHMMPQATEYLSSISWVAGSMLLGLLVMFFLLRVFPLHAHGGPDGHDHAHDGQSHEGHSHKGHQFSWVGLFVGLAIHSLMDGVALSASVVAEAKHATSAHSWIGLGTFLAVALHKPLDALSVMSLMRAAHWPRRSLNIVNVLFALTCPLGALLFWFGISHVTVEHSGFIGCILGFSAGFFLCIALSDLLPEVAFHSHDRFRLSASLLLGVALAVGIEMMHTHSHDHGHGEKHHGSHGADEKHGHSHHDH